MKITVINKPVIWNKQMMVKLINEEDIRIMETPEKRVGVKKKLEHSVNINYIEE